MFSIQLCFPKLDEQDETETIRFVLSPPISPEGPVFLCNFSIESRSTVVLLHSEQIRQMVFILDANSPNGYFPDQANSEYIENSIELLLGDKSTWVVNHLHYAGVSSWTAELTELNK